MKRTISTGERLVSSVVLAALGVVLFLHGRADDDGGGFVLGGGALAFVALGIAVSSIAHAEVRALGYALMIPVPYVAIALSWSPMADAGQLYILDRLVPVCGAVGVTPVTISLVALARGSWRARKVR